MKRFVSLTLLLAALLCLLSTTTLAASASASLTGPSEVRAGDTITVTFAISGTNILGIEGALSFDPNIVTLVSTKSLMDFGKTGWLVTIEDTNAFVAYDDNLAKPIVKKTEIFSATFKVNSNLATGTEVKISVTNLIASIQDSNDDLYVNTATYSTTILPPKSKDNSLKSMTVSNATISPAFNPNTTAYTAEVPFEVSKLNVSAAANDSKAKVTVSSPNLVVNGTTKVTVKVTAENGSTKTYTITVKRAQDPNYVPSGKNEVSSITVTDFKLSPAFNPETTSYVVWLPYETDSIKVAGAAADKNASVQIVGGDNLVPGSDNVVKVICTAENGEVKEYTIIAKRAAAHGSDPVIPGPTEPSNPVTPSDPTVPSQPTTPSDPTVPSTPTQPTDPVEPTTPTVPNDPTNPTVPAQTQPQETVPQQKPGNEQPSGGIPVVVLVIASVACLAIGAAGGFVIGKKKQ